MVAVVHCGKSLRVVLNYNEQKVKAGAAVCLEAGYYPKAAADLNFYQKLSRLEKLTELNQRTQVNSLHVSLNFDPSEKLDDDRMRQIAADYLERIGFAGQPYLLYRHIDAGHPHIHLLTTNIKPDGSRIPLHNIGRDRSEKARQEIEKIYGLVRAEDQPQPDDYRLRPVNAKDVIYGRMETRRAISNVLTAVLAKYRFGSLAELNAVLGCYHVQADRGTEDSRVFKHEGLLYHVLDDEGKRVGIPIKASALPGKPGLKFLKEKFTVNAEKKKPLLSGLRVAIDKLLLEGKMDLPELARRLQEVGIEMVIRKNDEGVIYGITYVDHRSACVANGSALGKTYSAKAILEHCKWQGAGEKKNTLGTTPETGRDMGMQGGSVAQLPDFARALLDPGDQPQQMDWQFKRKRKKKKRIRPEGS